MVALCQGLMFAVVMVGQHRRQGHCVILLCTSSLDLDAWINEPPSDSESEDEKPKAIFHEEEPRHTRRRQPEEDEEELARVSATFQ